MHRPYVAINVAATVDGKIDTVERRGAPVSSDADRDRVDRLRAAVDAVMVGGRTLHSEDPRLTVKSAALQQERLARGQPLNPAKVAITSRLDFRPDSRFLSAGPARIILFLPRGQASAAAPAGVEVYAIVDPGEAMARLYELGIRRVLVEGGGTLNFELLRMNLVDELQVFVSPLIFGGASAPTLADGNGLARDLAIKLDRFGVECFDDGGVLLRYRVQPA